MNASPTPAPANTPLSDGVRSGPRRHAARWTGLGFVVTGAAFLLYPALRPWGDETALAGALGITSAAWVLAHLSAVVGFIVFTMSLFGLRELTRGTDCLGRALRHAAGGTWPTGSRPSAAAG